MLDDPRSTPVESIELGRAVLETLSAQTGSSQAELDRERARILALTDRIASSLADYPEIRAAFLDHHAP
jgi:hypothetical protein